MRNPERIDDFCNELAELWHKVPDWRFGQFICNTFNEIAAREGDPFFWEDDKTMNCLKECFK